MKNSRQQASVRQSQPGQSTEQGRPTSSPMPRWKLDQSPLLHGGFGYPSPVVSSSQGRSQNLVGPQASTFSSGRFWFPEEAMTHPSKYLSSFMLHWQLFSMFCSVSSSLFLFDWPCAWWLNPHYQNKSYISVQGSIPGQYRESGSSIHIDIPIFSK